MSSLWLILHGRGHSVSVFLTKPDCTLEVVSGADPEISQGRLII